MKNVKLILILLCVALAACSSDDEQEQNTDGRKLRQLTIADVPVTRATLTVSESGKTLGATWNKNDVATYFNVTVFDEGDMNYGNLKASSSGKTSTFTGTVYCKEGDDIALLYPAKEPDHTSGDDRGKFTISLDGHGQKGTLEDIQEYFHYVYGVAKVTLVTEGTANATISTMKSLLAVCKFTFKDADNKLIPVETLKISYYDHGSAIGYPHEVMLKPKSKVDDLVLDYYENQPLWYAKELEVKPESVISDGVVYVALFPTNSNQGMSFTVTDGSGNTYTGTATAKLTAGKYYPAYLTLNKQ